ncbi:GIY-YIG nuclease family protein [Gramella sp. GC03-9]|uniref:GIY-YIG nuclease family protein n=1 Tax=Christiangramia oceanisediminis TaxID=2920386 RepID=A0A9X2I930_9FLAO|nr:GIY-YIG nuclease family protein [Gramella oceanisediminis]MCP9199492.1 GIY-YIG nuclease family protein [Gramella oceanisediminis]
MKKYFVYILECSDGLLYTGITNDPDRRLNEHNSGLDRESFTFKRRPVKIIFLQDFSDVEQAIYFEKKIKKWSSKKKLALAKGEYDFLPLLSECKNSSHSKNYKREDN